MISGPQVCLSQQIHDGDKKKKQKQKTNKQKKNMATDVWMFVNVDVATEVDYK